MNTFPGDLQEAGNMIQVLLFTERELGEWNIRQRNDLKFMHKLIEKESNLWLQLEDSKIEVLYVINFNNDKRERN